MRPLEGVGVVLHGRPSMSWSAMRKHVGESWEGVKEPRRGCERVCLGEGPSMRSPVLGGTNSEDLMEEMRLLVSQEQLRRSQ